MYIRLLETVASPAQLFETIKDEPYAFFLDSARYDVTKGRYSMMGCCPEVTYTVRGREITVDDCGKRQVTEGDAFGVLEVLFKKYQKAYRATLPFMGGFVGYLGYGMAHHAEVLPKTTTPAMAIPDAFFGLYDGVLIYDHLEEKAYLASLECFGSGEMAVASLAEKLSSAVAVDVPPRPNASCPAYPNLSKSTYLEAVASVRDYIRRGDIYQVNFTQQLKAPLSVPPYDVYRKLRTVNPAPFAAYFNLGDAHIVSSSPERFIQIQNGVVETRPIKGTRTKSLDPLEDARIQTALLNSEKDRSELLMIVDLERNDLGRVSKVGTVKVPELFKLETYETVHHLVAAVTGELRSDVNAVSCLKAVFPGGSITGAPKIRAMEVIDELEPTSRHLYTGAIGYIALNGDADFNIVIRTLLCQGGWAHLGIGGGVVWDSDPLAEYQESLDKGGALLEALNATVEEAPCTAI